MEFKDRLKILREEKNWTKSEAAKKIGISYSAYSNYEYGNREPNQKILKKISDTFDISMSYLIDGKKNIADMDKQELTKLIHELGNLTITHHKSASFSDSMHDLISNDKSDFNDLQTIKKLKYPFASIQQINFLISCDQLVESQKIDSSSPIYSNLSEIITILNDSKKISEKNILLLKDSFNNILEEIR